MNREFGKLHPAVNFILFLLLIVLSSAVINPILSPISLIAAVLTVCVTGKAAKLLPALLMMLPMATVVLAVNALFNGNGVTVLFELLGRQVTFEALAYGALSAVAFSSVLLWACLLGETLGADEIIYLFGGISPYPALLVSMVLGLIPTMLNRLKQIRDLRKSGTAKRKTVLGDLTTLVFWSLEASLETAASMRSRGFGCCKANRLVSYKFRPTDFVVSAGSGFLLAALIVAKARGYFYSVYPIFALPDFDLATVIFTSAFCLLMFVPLMHEVREKLRWRFSASRV